MAASHTARPMALATSHTAGPKALATSRAAGPKALATSRAALVAGLAASLCVAVPAEGAPPASRPLGHANLVLGAQGLEPTLAALGPRSQVAWLAPATASPFQGGSRQHHGRVHQGARVIDQDLLVFVDSAGRQLRALANIRPIDELAGHGVSPAQAADLATTLHAGAAVISTEALWVPGDGGYEPVHSVSLRLPGGLSRTLWIDAADQPRLRREIDPLRSYEGTVQVYDSSVAHGPLVVRPVTDLKYETWLSVEDRVIFDRDHDDPQPLQYDEDATFHWEPEDWRFSIAMGYYHLQQGEAFFQERTGGMFEGFVDPDIGMVNIGQENDFDDPSLVRRAGHAYSEGDNGWVHVYLLGAGTTGSVTMANFGNFAHAAEVWIHEQGHAVNAEATPFFDPEVGDEDPEYAAIEEGLADYGAAIYTGDPLLLEHVAAEVPEMFRDLAELRIFPDDFDEAGDEHPNGQIIGSAGWTLRERIGADPADRIVLGSRYYLSSSAHDFRALADGMVMADEDGHGGRYAVPVLETLALHGIPAHALSWPPIGDPVLEGALLDVGDTVRVLADTSDREGEVVAFSWSIVEAPTDSAVQSVEGEERWESEFSFVPDVKGTWVVELRVSDDDWQLSEPSTLEIVIGEELVGDGCACETARAAGRESALLLPGLLLLGLARRRRGPG